MKIKPFGGTIPISGPRSVTVGDGLILVGDAAGFTSPLFEGGSHLALWSGREAAELLASDSLLRTSFEQAKAIDAELRENARAQLNWLYRASPHYEGTANRYPVYKSTNDRK